MFSTCRIVPRTRLKYDTSWLGGDGNEAKRFSDGRRWQLSIEDALQKFDPAGLLEILWRCHPRGGQSRAPLPLRFANVTRHRFDWSCSLLSVHGGSAMR